MSDTATFPCPWCGASLSIRALGGQFACPFCRRKVTIPETSPPPSRGDTQTHVGINALLARPTRASAPPVTEWFSAPLSSLQIAQEASVGFLLVGPHAPEGEVPRLRAVDIYNRGVAWETLHGEPWIGELDARTMRQRGRNLYLVSGKSIIVRDIYDGGRRWAVQLSQRVETHEGRGARGGPEIIDPCPEGGRGAVIVRTIDHALASFDRDTGHPLWRRRVPTGAFKQFEAVEGSGVVLRYWQGTDGKLEFVNPFREEPVKSPGFGTDADFQRVVIDGRFAIAKVEQWGDSEKDGILVLDGATGEQVFFEPMANIADSVRPVVAWGRVYCAVERGEIVVSAPRGVAARSPLAGYAVTALLVVGATLFALVRRTQGSPSRRLFGLDPSTLAPRFDCGDLGTITVDAAPVSGSRAIDSVDFMVANAYVLVAVRCTSGDPKQCELFGIDAATGEEVWARPVGTWLEHFFLGGYVVAWSKGRVDVLNPNDGQPIAGYPFAP